MKRVGSIIIFLLIAITFFLGYKYIKYRKEYAVSDAAFIKSDKLLNLAFRVDGKVIKLTKSEGQEVKKGELLGKIEDIDFLIEKKRVKNKIKALLYKKEAFEIKKNKLFSSLDIKKVLLLNKKLKLAPTIKALEYEINSLKAKLNKLNIDYKRVLNLYKNKVAPKDKLEQLKTKKDELINIINAKKAKLKVFSYNYKDIEENLKLLKIEKKSLIELDKEINSLKKEIDALNNLKEVVNKKIEYTFLKSPINGKIAKKFISKYRVIKAGSLIYSIIDLNKLHLEVLLSEKKLYGIKVGNSVKIKVDAIKNKEFKGEVESILPASAATFSLVPRDIASGEFTKLDQRFVVRIKFLEYDKRFRVGMSAEVAIKRDKE